MIRYREEGYIVWDARNGNVIPAIGAGDDPADCVYTKSAADEMATWLNAMVHRNSGLAGIFGKVEGPFWVRTAALRSQLEGRRR